MVERSSASMDKVESSICTICLEAVRDGRLLDCLHTFCKGCLDDLDMRTGHARTITCPVCRSTNSLPENGASGLPRDITIVEEAPSECHTCNSAGGGHGKPELSCTTCTLAFCREHVGEHIIANPGHFVTALGKGRALSSFRPPTYSSSARLCGEHGLPAMLYCKQCNIAVCGGCIAFGEHHGHKPIVAVKNIANDLKERVRHKTEKLKEARLPEALRYLSAVEDVSTALLSRAENIRTQIRTYAKRAHETIEFVMQQKLAQVDDMEELRLKHLSDQQDELKRYTDSLKSVVHFGEKVMEKEVETEAVCDLLLAVDKRADEVDKTRVAEKPVEHAHVDFKSVSEDTLLAKLNELVGDVLLCQASPEHSYFEGALEKSCHADSFVNWVIVAKDCNNRRLSTGGDSIRVELQRTSAGPGPGRGPTFDVNDNNNGTYSITVAVKQEGNYSFDVFINDVKMQESLSISCPTWTFDLAECQTGSTITEDKLTVTHTGRDGTWSSVLCSAGMRAGPSCKVKVKSKDMGVFIGVAKKPGLTAKSNNYGSTYSWHGSNFNKYVMGNNSAHGMNKWKENDVLQLHLDCSKHTLSIINLRSGETDTIADLPSTELFLYVATYNNGDSLQLIP